MKALVVEDQAELLQILAQTLREDGYIVDTATDGPNGLFKALDIAYDVMVLDIMLPQMNGWELLKKLREQKKNTPVLLLTARDTVHDRIRGLDAGADDYLTKPCNLAELLARLKALIRRSATPPRPIIEIGDVVFNLGLRTVSRHSREVMLTAREYAVAEYLAINRGKVVTRSALNRHLLNEGDESPSNLVAVHIYNLRKKLGPNFILTRRGIGYRIP
ncbi:response regulator transcription factor [Phragmitibacter flavus]|uniref:Response regulator transcription factor n=2 Tax=Phragmitibacter flavus TaxID=2576071 RepID=A0A5R8K9K1_9BACT|nr:response regulator transcription factor [Phragmitibacter flavus]